MIKIVKESFDLENEFKNISSNKNGAYSFFLGTVRSDLSFSNTEIKGIYLESVSYTHLTLPTRTRV